MISCAWQDHCVSGVLINSQADAKSVSPISAGGCQRVIWREQQKSQQHILLLQLAPSPGRALTNGLTQTGGILP